MDDPSPVPPELQPEMPVAAPVSSFADELFVPPTASVSALGKLVWSWGVVGFFAALLLSGWYSFMTSGHPFIADGFVVAATALFIAKFVTWEDARKHAKWVVPVACIASAVLCAGAITGNHILNRPPAATVVSSSPTVTPGDVANAAKNGATEGVKQALAAPSISFENQTRVIFKHNLNNRAATVTCIGRDGTDLRTWDGPRVIDADTVEITWDLPVSGICSAFGRGPSENRYLPATRSVPTVSPAPLPQKASLEFVFGKNLTPMQSISLPVTNDIVKLPFSVVLSGPVVAVEGTLWAQICDACGYAVLPNGWTATDAATPKVINGGRFNHVYVGVHLPTMFLDIVPPQDGSSFQVGFLYTCENCPGVDPKTPQLLTVTPVRQ
jgi:hypothetical protein